MKKLKFKNIEFGDYFTLAGGIICQKIDDYNLVCVEDDLQVISHPLTVNAKLEKIIENKYPVHAIHITILYS